MNGVITGHVFYRTPVKVYPVAVKGEGVFIYDADGKRYLDGSSGAVVANIGHGVSEVAEAIANQAKKIAFAHGSQFTNETQEKLAEAIARLTPGSLKRSYFVSGGSEATETALKMARMYYLQEGKASKFKVIARWNSYHGNTLGALSLSGSPGRRRLYTPLLLDFPHIPAPYCFRCHYGLRYPDCQLRCAYALEEAVLLEGPENVAAFIAEPVIGSSASGVVPPPEYYKIIRAICDRHDLLMIADEVMTGFGRTGHNFGINNWNVVPDMMTVAKGISGGYAPLGALIVKEEIHEVFLKGTGKFNHGHTYGGNAVSCAAGLAAQQYIQEHQLIANANMQGTYLREKLQSLSNHRLIGEVRGLGLMIGVEFVRNKSTREPFPQSSQLLEIFVNTAFGLGLIVYPGAGDHILIAPPLTITRSEIDLLVELFERTLELVEDKVN